MQFISASTCLKFSNFSKFWQVFENHWTFEVLVANDPFEFENFNISIIFLSEGYFWFKSSAFKTFSSLFYFANVGWFMKILAVWKLKIAHLWAVETDNCNRSISKIQKKNVCKSWIHKNEEEALKNLLINSKPTRFHLQGQVLLLNY